MTQLTQEQELLIESYADYGEEELINLLGNQLDEYGSESLRQTYVFGAPNVLERGRQFLSDTGRSLSKSVCPARQEIAHKITAFCDQHKGALAPMGWTATLLDIGIARFTADIPPITVAVTLGKICDYSIDKFCQKFAQSNP